jgi:hypothetical protein
MLSRNSEALIGMVKASLYDTGVLSLTLVPLVFLGLVFASLAYRVRRVKKAAICLMPLCKAARLPPCCSLYFLLCFLNPPAATMTLVEFRGKGLIGDKTVIVASLVGGLPVMVYVTTFFTVPVTLPILDISTAFLLLASFIACGVIQTGLGVILGRTVLVRGRIKGDVERVWLGESASWKKSLISSLKEASISIWEVTKRLVPTLFVAFLFIHSGIMALFAKAATPLSLLTGLPTESVQVTATAAVNFVAAIGIGSSLSEVGLLTGKQVVLSLMCGLFIFNMIELFHTTLPYNISFFGPKLGVKVAFTTFFAIGASEAVMMMLLLLSIAGH